MNTVVPKPELMEANVKLVLAYFKTDQQLNIGTKPEPPIWEEKEPLEDEELWREDGGPG